MVDIEDIAHALSNICRYGGHCRTFYSVAQHSVIVSNLVPDWAAKYGLLHDAAEAYVGDVVRPIKRKLPLHSEMEEKVLDCIYEHLGVPRVKSGMTKALIKHYDNVALLMERRDLVPASKGQDWEEDTEIYALLPEDKIIPLSPQIAKELFLDRWNQLKNSS